MANQMLGVAPGKVATKLYMEERFGAWQVDQDPRQGVVQFKIFIPDAAQDPDQHIQRPNSTYGNPRIASIQVIGDFQKALGLIPWDPSTAPTMTKSVHPKGWEWVYRTTKALPVGFYEYKYLVTFENGHKRWVTDPCCRYGGRHNQNAAVAVGGSFEDVDVLPVEQRLALRDLVQYELHPDDFTADFRGADAPLKAIIDKLPYLKKLGINALAIMPWTAWPGENHSWGYTPYLYYSVEQYYTEQLNASDNPNPIPVPSAERLVWLKRLITACHQCGIHVIMDGVFNHVGCAKLNPRLDSSDGFPYPWLYQDPNDCPYVGQYGGCFGGLGYCQMLCMKA